LTRSTARSAPTLDKTKALATIKASTDPNQLTAFRDKLTKANEASLMELISAIEDRLATLREEKIRRVLAATGATGNRNAVERAHLAIATLEELRGTPANRIRAAFKREDAGGVIGAVARTVLNNKMSSGLETLIHFGRLDLSFEQIILDFPDLFDAKTRNKAAANLAALATHQ
jgi:hypothetical protein